MDRLQLHDRTVLITGGAGFLGRQWADALLAAGATVISVDRVAPEPAWTHERLHHETADITDPTAIRELEARIRGAGRSVDVLVNNAALDAPVTADGLTDLGRLEDFDVERWNAEVNVGLTGAFICAQVFGTRMAARGHGVIVNVGSDLGLIAPDQRLYRIAGEAADRQPVKPVTYPVIKAGLIGLTRYLASYWAEDGVRANTLCLGGVEREQSPVFLERVAERIPLGRMARPGEYGAAMVFLCSDASSYMTGSSLVIDGGRTTW